jgi:hypothetical protein
VNAVIISIALWISVSVLALALYRHRLGQGAIGLAGGGVALAYTIWARRGHACASDECSAWLTIDVGIVWLGLGLGLLLGLGLAWAQRRKDH